MTILGRPLGLWLIRAALLFMAGALLWLWHSDVRAQVPAEAWGYQRLYIRIVTATWPTAPVASLAAQIQQESGWRCTAVSKVGARGCAQFMPATARWISSKYPGLGEGLVHDPAWSFQAQVRYMSLLYRETSGDTECERFAFALSGYNGGAGWAQKRKRLSPRPGICFGLTCSINPGIAPANQRENEEYPVRILKKIDSSYAKAGWGRQLCE